MSTRVPLVLGGDGLPTQLQTGDGAAIGAANGSSLALTGGPPTPASGSIGLGVVTLAGYDMLGTGNAEGASNVVSPLLGRMKFGDINWIQNLISSINCSGVFLSGNFSSTGGGAVVSSATNYGTRAVCGKYTSASAAGSYAGLYTSNVSGWPSSVTVGTGLGLGGFFYAFRFMVADTLGTNALMFVGLSSAASAPSPTTDPANLTNSIGIGVSSSDTSGNLCIICNGGSLSTTPYIDLGSNFPANTSLTDFYELLLFSSSNNSGVVWYTVNRYTTSDVPAFTVSGILSSAGGQTIPASTVFLGPRAWRSNNATASATVLYLNRVYFQANS